MRFGVIAVLVLAVLESPGALAAGKQRPLVRILQPNNFPRMASRLGLHVRLEIYTGAQTGAKARLSGDRKLVGVSGEGSLRGFVEEAEAYGTSAEKAIENLAEKLRGRRVSIEAPPRVIGILVPKDLPLHGLAQLPRREQSIEVRREPEDVVELARQEGLRFQVRPRTGGGYIASLKGVDHRAGGMLLGISSYGRTELEAINGLNREVSGRALAVDGKTRSARTIVAPRFFRFAATQDLPADLIDRD